MQPIDLCAAAAAVSSGTLRARTLLETSLDIAAGATCRHAFTRFDPESARAAAEAADAAVAAGRSPGPLAGLAVAVKDLFDVAGQPTAAGSRVLASAPPAVSDAPAVARLRAAGAALIGRNQMSEFAFSGVGLNPHQGTPANATLAAAGWPGHLPGGSTSGGAVAVAAGAAWAALGSDTGGSIRIPAALHGLVGYKCTQALTPTAGSVPLSPSLDTVCAITRSVRDAVRVHEILADRRVSDSVRQGADRTAARGLRLGVAPEVGFDGMDATVAAAIDHALRTLRDAGVHLEERSLPLLARTADLLVNGGIVAAEAWRWHRDRLATDAGRYDPRVVSRIRRGASTDDAQLAALHALRRRWIAEVETSMGEVDVWLMPTVPVTAPPIADLEASDEVFFAVNALMLRNPSLVNLLDGCAISLPCPAAGRAPVGLMLWSRGGLDDVLLAAAATVEAVLASSAPIAAPDA